MQTSSEISSRTYSPEGSEIQIRKERSSKPHQPGSRGSSPTQYRDDEDKGRHESDQSHSPSKLELAELKLQRINEKIIEIRRLRRERSPEGSISPLEKARRKRIEEEGHPRPKSNKLAPPHLTYMLAELAHSPYLTSPLKKYSQKTLEISGYAFAIFFQVIFKSDIEHFLI
jgi:hypothetical protein